MRLESWCLESVDGLGVVRCDALSDVRGVAHAFSTRLGPQGVDFDLGGHEPGEPAIVERRRMLLEAIGLGGQPATILHQVHGNHVLRVSRITRDEPLPEADGVFAVRGDRPVGVPAVRTADCVPVLLAEREARAVAAVHAGWRGAASGVVGRAVARLEQAGIPPRDLVAALGPAIGVCCYDVGGEVLEAVARRSDVPIGEISRASGARQKLDLRRAIAIQLRRAGLEAERVHASRWCTACREDLFYSFRRRGGPTGRLMACVGWSRPATADPVRP